MQFNVMPRTFDWMMINEDRRKQDYREGKVLGSAIVSSMEF